MSTIDLSDGGVPYIPPFSTAPVTVSRWPSIGGLASGLGDRARGAAAGLGDRALGAAEGLGDRALGAAEGLGDRALGAAEGLGDRALAAGEGLADQGLAMAQGAAGNALDSAAGALGLPTGAGGKQDPEEAYEEVLRRLRRDLVAELEQNGHLLRDNP
jgi:hypothetical protein